MSHDTIAAPSAICLRSRDEGLASRIQTDGKLSVAGTFAPVIKQKLNRFDYECLIPIPLSAERYQQRGFNQVTAVLEAAGVRFQELLEKVVDTAPQAQRSRRQRLVEAQPFAVKPDVACEIKGKNYC